MRRIAVRIVGCQLGSHSKCHQKATEEYAQQIKQDGFAAGMVRVAHCCQDTVSWGAMDSSTCF